MGDIGIHAEVIPKIACKSFPVKGGVQLNEMNMLWSQVKDMVMGLSGKGVDGV